MDILLWHEILEPYELAVKELQVKFRHLIKEHHGKGLYSPIESVSGRVKSVSSILEKMQRKGIVPEEMEEQVEDIAGIRIICQFVEDIEKVADLNCAFPLYYQLKAGKRRTRGIAFPGFIANNQISTFENDSCLPEAIFNK